MRADKKAPSRARQAPRHADASAAAARIGHKFVIASALLGVLPIASSPAARADAVGVFAGHGQSTDQYGFGIQLDRRTPVHEYPGSTMTAHLELGIGEFQGHAGAINHDTIRACEALGKLRWQWHSNGPAAPFVEFGIGMGGLSEVTLNGNRHFSTAFQFTEILRTGLRFGGRQQYEVAVGAQLFSNAGLSHPNDGITYAGLLAGWHWW